MKITLTRDFDFQAAHTLPGFPKDHKCTRVHGHTYQVSVSTTGKVDTKTGISCDHSKIAEITRPIIAELDHQYLNDIPGLENPSIELLAKWLWDKIQPKLNEISEITIRETPRASCTYRGD